MHLQPPFTAPNTTPSMADSPSTVSRSRAVRLSHLEFYESLIRALNKIFMEWIKSDSKRGWQRQSKSPS